VTALRPEQDSSADGGSAEGGSAEAEGSSDTLALRLPQPGSGRGAGRDTGRGAGPDAGPGAGPGGGRAARRRAERLSRRRGRWLSRRPLPPKVRESPGIVAVRTLGELFITLGVLLFLFVGYQLWWTNVTADAYASGAKHKLESQWSASGGDSASHPPYPASIAAGTKFAIIYIPKLDVETPIAEGVDKTTILDNGLVGHYTGDQETAFPWAPTGNFALAGHRNTHGEPFRYVNKLVPGDQVIVETAYDYYVYTITSTLAQTSPTNVSVIAPIPPQSGFTKPGRYITLTTCTPEFTSTYRMAVWGRLTQDLPKSSGQKPQALQSS
jgi:sortase A